MIMNAIEMAKGFLWQSSRLIIIMYNGKLGTV